MSNKRYFVQHIKYEVGNETESDFQGLYPWTNEQWEKHAATEGLSVNEDNTVIYRDIADGMRESWLWCPSPVITVQLAERMGELSIPQP